MGKAKAGTLGFLGLLESRVEAHESASCSVAVDAAFGAKNEHSSVERHDLPAGAAFVEGGDFRSAEHIGEGAVCRPEHAERHIMHTNAAAIEETRSIHTTRILTNWRLIYMNPSRCQHQNEKKAAFRELSLFLWEFAGGLPFVRATPAAPDLSKKMLIIFARPIWG
jgi:hypothetical protein